MRHKLFRKLARDDFDIMMSKFVRWDLSYPYFMKETSEGAKEWRKARNKWVHKQGWTVKEVMENLKKENIRLFLLIG